MSEEQNQTLASVGGRVEGVDLPSFLQMMNSGLKTCTLKVTTDDEIGFLHIKNGELIASETSELRDLEAAYTIIAWDQASIEIEALQPNKQVTIKTPMMPILLEAARIADEKSEQKASPKSGKRSSKIDKYVSLADQYTAEGNTEAAVKLLFDIIVKSAKARNFPLADSLLDKLQEVDPFALDEIVKAGELIDAEKSQAIDHKHMRSWSKLYSQFSTEEANELFFNLKPAAIKEGKLIMEQGKLNRHLYFIDAGQISRFCRSGSKTFFISDQGPGDLVGESSFFTLSVSTVSAVPSSNVNVYYLEKKVFERLKETKPILAAKLHDYCLNSQKEKKLLKPTDFNRRTHPRYKGMGHVIVTVLSPPQGMEVREFKTDLIDISKFGISTQVMIPKSKTASNLLGRAVKIKFLTDSSNPSILKEYQGNVVAVNDRLFNNYFLGIKLKETIDDLLIETLKKDDRPM